MALRADYLNVFVVLSFIAEIVIVFMAAFAGAPNVATINTWEQVGMKPAPHPNVKVNALAGLPLVVVARRQRQRSLAPNLWKTLLAVTFIGGLATAAATAQSVPSR